MLDLLLKGLSRLIMEFFYQGTFHLEGDADDLEFVTGTEIRKIGDRISGSAINIDRLKKLQK